MYSAVLMLALTAGSETVDSHRNRCNGGGNGYGCAGSVVGGGCSGSYGCSNSGHGGGLFGGRSRGCSSSVGHGCSGRGGLFGGGLFGGRNGCSNGNGCSSGYSGYSNGHHGCSNGQHGCAHSTGSGCSSGTIIVPETKLLPKSEPVPIPKKGAVQSAAPATIIVSLPADARLFVDGNATTSTSARRALVTPELAFGTTYVYTFRAEIVRDGNVQTQTQQVNVIGGQTATVQFNLSSQGVASR